MTFSNWVKLDKVLCLGLIFIIIVIIIIIIIIIII